MISPDPIQVKVIKRITYILIIIKAKHQHFQMLYFLTRFGVWSDYMVIFSELRHIDPGIAVLFSCFLVSTTTVQFMIGFSAHNIFIVIIVQTYLKALN